MKIMDRRLVLTLVTALVVVSPAVVCQESKIEPAQNTPAPVVVFGAVKSPGRYVPSSKQKLADLIALAGGITRHAGKKIMLVHTESARTCNAPTTGGPLFEYQLTDVLHRKKDADPCIRPGDIIIVSEAEPVIVTGNVRHPQTLPLKDKLSLLKAIRLSGGVKENGPRVKIRVAQPVRCSLHDVFQFDWQAVKEGRIKDSELQQYSLVEVSDREGNFHADLSGSLCRSLANGYPKFDSRPLVPKTR